LEHTGTLFPEIFRHSHAGYFQAYELDWLLDVKRATMSFGGK
jgi:hypothetical protein